jgi:hypothetical protein
MIGRTMMTMPVRRVISRGEANNVCRRSSSALYNPLAGGVPVGWANNQLLSTRDVLSTVASACGARLQKLSNHMRRIFTCVV